MDFIAPKNFDEYLERYPDWHKAWLAKHHPRIAFSDGAEDAQQHLLLESLRKQRVEKYDAFKRRMHAKDKKDAPGLFLSWMAKCFSNDMNQRYTEKKRARRRAMEGTISIDDLSTGGGYKLNSGNSDDEGISLLSQHYRLRARREGKVAYTTVQINQFRAFVAKHRPELVAALDEMLMGVTRTNDLHKFSILAEHMQNGTIPNRPRKQYRPRKKSGGQVKYKITRKWLEELASRGLLMREAAAEIGCSHGLLWDRCKKLTGHRWKGLVEKMSGTRY